MVLLIGVSSLFNKTPPFGFGAYCWRSSETKWSEEKLWRTYAMFAVWKTYSAVPRALRPVFHSKENRCNEHSRRTKRGTVQVQKSTIAEPALKKIYAAFGVTERRVGIKSECLSRKNHRN
ncbi:hypothetical protein PO883_14485 [Massilia sp. DJPM01]|uniref:hypothetical protein n=1 Tax=Massilia sp. DJPM01 TaxID=3024404 RepID=UPI00259D6D5A|nr:hypothetical protein [Massilia sp. DJPM01]MDM5178403.1 hypothetical protein [Massilia sp. DJPM01]